ncbi:MAG: HEAT repeat domain-containing protein [Acidobacteriota bacterium]
MSRQGPAQIEYGLSAASPKVSLERLAENFASRPMPTRAAMAEMFDTHRAEFIAEAITLIRAGKSGQGHRFILTHLTETGAFLEILVDRKLMTQDEAVELMRVSMRLEPQFDIRLMRWLVDSTHKDIVMKLGPQAEALLDILTQSSPGNRMLPVAIQLLRSSGAHVRSRAALLVAQRNQRVDLALADSDSRVRANAIEALWGQRTPGSRRALVSALDDSNNRVVGNAILGLFKLGELSVVPRLLEMVHHPSPLFRATAAWIIGQTADRAFLPRLEELAKDADENVVRAANEALAKFVQASVAGIAEVQQSAALRILRVTESGTARRRLSALARLPKPPVELPATARLACNGQPALEVQMRYMSLGALAIGVLLPDNWPQEVHDAVRRLLNQKGDADRVALISYQPGRPIQSQQTGKTPPPRVVYSLVPSVPARTRPDAGPGMIPALQALMNAPTGLAAQANLVMFVTEAESLQMHGASDSLMMVAQQADQTGAFLHVIAAPDLPEAVTKTLQAVCGETGGYYLKCNEPADYATNMEYILQILREGIEVSYREAAPTAGSKLELQIVSGSTIARATAECDNSPYNAQNGSSIWYC